MYGRLSARFFSPLCAKCFFLNHSLQSSCASVSPSTSMSYMCRTCQLFYGLDVLLDANRNEFPSFLRSGVRRWRKPTSVLTLPLNLFRQQHSVVCFLKLTSDVPLRSCFDLYRNAAFEIHDKHHDFAYLLHQSSWSWGILFI